MLSGLGTCTVQMGLMYCKLLYILRTKDHNVYCYIIFFGVSTVSKIHRWIQERSRFVQRDRCDGDGLKIVSKGKTGRKDNLLSGRVLQERLVIGRLSVTEG